MSKKDINKEENISEEDMQVLDIDPDRGWNFNSEEDLFKFFEKDIKAVEEDFSELKDYTDKENPTHTLEFTLDQPDKIWMKKDYFDKDRPLWIYTKNLNTRKEWIFCHCYDKEPSFIYTYLSLPADFEDDFLEKRDFEIIKEGLEGVPRGAIEGDSLTEKDELSMGLYKAMMTLRSTEDLMEEDFVDFADMREPAIEEADEIWRTMDSYGNHLVYFIKEFEFKNELDSEKLFYVVVTIEDSVSESNVLLFSFPTFDETLVERYRVGDNLQSDDVVQEGSH